MTFVAQGQYQVVFDNAPEAIAVIDVDGAIVTANRAVEQTFGHAPCEVAGHNVGMLLAEPAPSVCLASQPKYDPAGLRAMAGIPREAEGRRKDGSIVPLDLSVSEWMHGGETFFTVIMRDISRRKNMESALRASEEQLRLLQNDFAHLARVNDLGEMAAAIAHEINQPLTAIVNFLHAGVLSLAKEVTDEAVAAARQAMDLAAEQGLRAGAIVRGLREFATKGRGGRRPERADALVEAAMALALVDIRRTGIWLEHKPAGDVMVEVDRVQIQQVLVNLLRNAVEALSANPPGTQRHLSIVVRELAEERIVEFCVADTGPGIPPELCDRLFEPFVTSKPDGMGMGLSVCRRIVEAHNGTIGVKCGEGSGAEFRIRLPIFNVS
jgi:two-component system sensor kinase FixL